MKLINGLEIKPGAGLRYAGLSGANLRYAVAYCDSVAERLS
jgi:hypothetical protein